MFLKIIFLTGHFHQNNMVNLNQNQVVTFARMGWSLFPDSPQRYSTTEIDGVGNITAINRFKNGPTGSDVATTDIEYNSLRQLTKVIQPRPQMSSNNSERMFYEYTYDDTFKLFVTEVTDAYGFTGSTEYDHYGMPLKQADLNGTEFEYAYDPLRRVTQFK